MTDMVFSCRMKWFPAGFGFPTGDLTSPENAPADQRALLTEL